MQVARRSDVDMNGHINNVTYIAWALETVPRDVYYNYELQQVVSLHCLCTQLGCALACVHNCFAPPEANACTDSLNTDLTD